MRNLKIFVFYLFILPVLGVHFSLFASPSALSDSAEEKVHITYYNSLDWLKFRFPNVKNLNIYVTDVQKMSNILDQLAQFSLLEKVEFYFARVMPKELMSDEIIYKILTLTNLKEIRYTFSVDRDYYYYHYSYYSQNFDYLNKQREFLQQYTSTIIHIDCHLGVDEKCG